MHMTRENKIAVIPARGGSKRLPGKNLMNFLGRPIIHYTIEAALKSDLFDTVVVSTEDEDIRRIVEGTGCEIHNRDPRLATDTARAVHVIKDIIDSYARKGGLFDCLCCLYPTAPLRDAEDIQSAYDLMRSSRADYCMAVTEYPYSPFFAFNLHENGRIERRWPEFFRLPPWEKPKVVVDNGSMYWARVERFLESGELEGDNTVAYRMPRWKSVDIDTAEDFEWAEFVARRKGS